MLRRAECQRRTQVCSCTTITTTHWYLSERRCQGSVSSSDPLASASALMKRARSRSASFWRSLSRSFSRSRSLTGARSTGGSSQGHGSVIEAGIKPRHRVVVSARSRTRGSPGHDGPPVAGRSAQQRQGPLGGDHAGQQEVQGWLRGCGCWASRQQPLASILAGQGTESTKLQSDLPQ